MKKIIYVLFCMLLCTSLYADQYVARVVCEEYTVGNKIIGDRTFHVGEVIARWIIPDGEVLPTYENKQAFIITKEEYETGNIEQTKIDNAVATFISNRKDFEVKLSKLDKAILLTLIDAINALRVKDGDGEYTIQQIKTAVQNKYDSLGECYEYNGRCSIGIDFRCINGCRAQYG